MDWGLILKLIYRYVHVVNRRKGLTNPFFAVLLTAIAVIFTPIGYD
jgi:hypothetical protein